MKRVFAFLLCLLLVGSCAFTALAAPADSTYDPTEANTGSTYGRNFFILVLVLAVAGSIYLYFCFRK